MATQEHVALARSLLDLCNSSSDPAWLDKSAARTTLVQLCLQILATVDTTDWYLAH